MFVKLEHNAATLRSVRVEVIPGLLQTDNYIRALHADAQVLPFDARTFAGRIAYRLTLLNIPAPGIAARLIARHHP